jgi:murein DD-endopeptidase MepM/ murein hydrolase activator NlpD
MLILERIILLIVGVGFAGCSFVAPTPEYRKVIRYPVKQGDTLYEIGQRFDTNFHEIANLNDLDDPDELEVGMVLRIPYREQRLAIPNSLEQGGRARMTSLPPPPLRDDTSKKPDKWSQGKIALSGARFYVGKLRWPLRVGKITSLFGRRWFSFHEGIDLSAPEGTPVYASHDGEIVYSNNGLKGYGNLVVIRADRGLMSVYAHNSRLLVSRGARVRTGDRIALAGQTGKATGPHVHFETRIKDEKGRYVAVDPLVFLRRPSS